MGIFYSYCKNCNGAITWFMDQLKSCANCGTLHSNSELFDSINKPTYYRAKKIEKLLNPNNLFINDKKWETFSDDELEYYIQSVYRYYRKNGFPFFKLTGGDIIKVLKKMCEFDSSTLLLEDGKLKQVMLGLNLVNYYMPHMWETKCHSFTTPMDCFNSDDMLMKAIRKRVKFGSNMSDAGMCKTLSWTSGTHRVSNFRPTIAKYIYDNYSGNGNVLDFSSGYGGRMLGAMVSKKVERYTGVEPNMDTYVKLSNMSSLVAGFVPKMYNDAFEDVDFGTTKFDLSFSSPPYFNTEEYAYDDKQSFVRYKTKEEWRDKFLTYLIKKNYELLTDGGYFIINIANVKTYPELEEDTVRIAVESGFKLIKTYKMSLSSLMKSGFKYEPIFVFKKL